MKIKAAITHEKGTMSLEELELAPPGEKQVLVRMVACGVCHTDDAGINQLIPVALPAVFGHEGVGVVEELGPGVTGLKKGDRVIMTFPSCGACDYCAEGHPYACDNLNTLFFNGSYIDGTKRLSQNGVAVSSFFGQGAFATHAVVDERNAVKADVASDDDLAYLCSLGCGVQTGAGAVLNRLCPEKGSSIAVFGCGGVGMSAVMGAAIAGCATIIAVDVAPSRLAMAKELGATHAINGKECDAVEEIRKITKGGAQYSVESSGVPALTLQALNCLRREGTATVVSVTGPAEVGIALEPMLMNKSATLCGLTEGGSNPPVFIPELVKYYREGRLPVDKLVKFYKFEDIKQAFADSHSGVTIKPILRF
ncbi:MAG: NAD(P)-dependent alcohol dehydrogenase [Clostridiales Family XIII bacterium]|jgi:aryl-alcohol dehydrogenase|nr:NAD(P)-dependent alcohol dehydrogenase [Clostridiales Family XIII bacterium]